MSRKWMRHDEREPSFAYTSRTRAYVADRTTGLVDVVTPTVIRADARCLPIADNTVDLIVTSPPYFALRSYRDGGDHYEGQIGCEESPSAFVQALVDCTREWMRVLKPTGSLWINLGDKYAGGGGGPDRKRDRTPFASTVPNLRGQTWGAPQKSLLGIPWRYALACIEQLGLVLRAEVIWSKPNALPESVTDRVRRDHEQWFHFTTQGRYYAAVDELREPHSTGARADQGGLHRGSYCPGERGDGAARKGYTSINALGRLPGSVWTIASEPLSVPAALGLDHFAAFPVEFPRRIITGWSPIGICRSCGEGRRPIAATDPVEGKAFAAEQQASGRGWHLGDPSRRTLGHAAGRRSILGYTCACPEPSAQTRPAVVLDPFGGTGTTALAASVLGRLGVSVDLSSDYCRLARWRTTDPGERARAMRVEKPPVQATGQEALDFGGAA